MRKRTWFFLLLLGMLFSIGVVLFGQLSQPAESSQLALKVFLFPIGTCDESYCFWVDEDLNLFSAVGSRSSSKVQLNTSLVQITDSKKTPLTQEEVQNLKQLADAVADRKEDFPQNAALDSWTITICYQTGIYETDYWNSGSEEINRLIKYILSLSPLQINLHSWA